MENLIIKGQITATSNKVNEDYKTDNPTKTAYVTVTDDNIRKAMVNFGLTEYTSKQDDTNFFIIKLPQQLTLVKGNHMRKMSGDVESPNIKTKDDEEFKMNIIKGRNKGNDFFRLQAIEVNDYSDVEQILMENPFGSGYLKSDDNAQPVDISEDDLPF